MSSNSPKGHISGDVWVLRIALLALFFGTWQVATAGNPLRTFFFGSPTLVARELWSGLRHGLVWDTLVTAAEAFLGFCCGNILGAAAGLALWRSPRLFGAVRPYVVALGSAPLFAFAPILVVWFGIGFAAKAMIAFLSTVFVALMQAYTGADSVGTDLIELVRSLGGDSRQVFRKVVVPASFVWVASGFRLNVGLALLGAFLGEYISSERGLGHVIVIAGGLYNIPLVLAAVGMIVVVGWALLGLVNAIDKPLLRFLVRVL